MITPSARISSVIMAGGKGTRINALHVPKVMLEVKGRPMIDYVLAALRASVIHAPPVVVVGYQADQIRQHLGDSVRYAFQAQQLGTGHAVACARALLENQTEQIVVLNGDHPTVRAQTINRLVNNHLRNDRLLTLATVTVPDFADWRVGMLRYGHVVRDAQGWLEKIVEYKDASQQQRQIKEVSPNYFCFQADWLWQHVDKITNHNAAHEYYLPDLVAMAIQANPDRVGTISAAPAEALGINTQEELELIERLI